MLFSKPKQVSQFLLTLMGTKLFVTYGDRIPQEVPVIVVSNHRSFMDAAVLIDTIDTPLRIACHHYMEQTPILRDLIHWLGCFALPPKGKQQRNFLEQADRLLASQQWIGIFPEGTPPMVAPTEPEKIESFHRGFAHLALKASVSRLAILPIAIASVEETIYPAFPIRWLRLFDPSEPYFKQSGLHPMVVYHRVNVLVGRPYWIGEGQKQQYQGKQAKKIVNAITNHCEREIAELLQQGCV